MSVDIRGHCLHCGKYNATSAGCDCQHRAVFGEGQAPHKCPICEGHGNVAGGFYTALPGCAWASDKVSEPCRSCNATGIIWR